MPKMYHPALPSTYDDPHDVTQTAYEAVWQQVGWRLVDEDDDEVEDLTVLQELAWSTEEDTYEGNAENES